MPFWAVPFSTSSSLLGYPPPPPAPSRIRRLRFGREPLETRDPNFRTGSYSGISAETTLQNPLKRLWGGTHKYMIPIIPQQELMYVNPKAAKSEKRKHFLYQTPKYPEPRNPKPLNPGSLYDFLKFHRGCCDPEDCLGF